MDEREEGSREGSSQAEVRKTGEEKAVLRKRCAVCRDGVFSRKERREPASPEKRGEGLAEEGD